jgi:tRNA nucleotidyltransferase/poly(A) polymerase
MVELARTNAITEMYFKKYSKTGFKKKLFPVKDIEAIYSEMMLPNIFNKLDDEFIRMVKDLKNLGTAIAPTSGLSISLNRKKMLAENRVQHKVQSLNKETKQLINILKDAFEEDAFIVGGFVRDAIAGYESNDVDLCTSIPYSKLTEVFRDAGWETKDTGKQFLVLNVIHPISKENFEIAALRRDKDNSGAEVGTIEEDAQRRDFVNSCIYFSLKTSELIDPSGMAILDCQNNVLRFMGKPKDRLAEDELRGWRFYKFVARGWEPESKTLRAVRENWHSIYKNSNPERVRRELESMLGM